MDLSLSDSTAKTVRASICKIAFKTIPRCGIAALILLCMGLYFLFPACQTFQQIQAEKNTPYELTATTDNSNINLNALMQIEGVERVSPVVNLNATLSLGEYRQNCKIRAVYNSFLSLKFTQGTMYPNSSNMPYLVLNRAAAKAFSHESQTAIVSPDDTVMMNENGIERKSIICGIFDDGSETPTVYMSYDVAQKEYGTNSQTELVFLLANMGSAEEVVSTLHRQNIYASIDPNLTLALKLLQAQCFQTAILGIGLLSSAIAVIRERHAVELLVKKSEYIMFCMAGIIPERVNKIYNIRMIMVIVLSLCLMILLASITETFSMHVLGWALGGCVYVYIMATVRANRI